METAKKDNVYIPTSSLVAHSLSSLNLDKPPGQLLKDATPYATTVDVAAVTQPRNVSQVKYLRNLACERSILDKMDHNNVSELHKMMPNFVLDV